MMDVEDALAMARCEDLFPEKPCEAPTPVKNASRPTIVFMDDRWAYNRQQAINRFLAGRALTKRTRETYHLTRDVLESLARRVRPERKYKYDRNAHLRRQSRGKNLSPKVREKYGITEPHSPFAGNRATASEEGGVDSRWPVGERGMEKKAPTQGIIAFKRRRSARVRRPNAKYICAFPVEAVKMSLSMENAGFSPGTGTSPSPTVGVKNGTTGKPATQQEANVGMFHTVA